MSGNFPLGGGAILTHAGGAEMGGVFEAIDQLLANLTEGRVRRDTEDAIG